MKEFPISGYYSRISRRGEPFDLALNGLCCSPDPVRVLAFFDGTTIGPRNNVNFSYLSDPAFDRKFAAVAKLSGSQARSRSGSGLRDDGQSRFLLGADRVPGVPASVGQGRGSLVPAGLTRVVSLEGQARTCRRARA